MLYREIIAVCSDIHTKHINILCGQNVELLNVKLVVHTVTTRLSYLPGSLHYQYRERARRSLCVTNYITASKFVNLYVRDFARLYYKLASTLSHVFYISSVLTAKCVLDIGNCSGGWTLAVRQPPPRTKLKRWGPLSET